MSDTREALRHGHCLCGSIQYKVRGEPEIVAHCHCDDCRRLSGAGHSTAAMFAKQRFTMTGDTIGEHKLAADNGNEVTRGFCTTCGSPIYGHNSGNEAFMSVTLGTLDDASGLVPEVAIFCRNREPWDTVDERVQCFDTQPGWKPEGSD